MLFSHLQLFFGSPALHLVLSIGGAAVFACLLVYDTHLIMQRFSAEEYIAAAITLYLDIINLFLYILRILQATDSHSRVIHGIGTDFRGCRDAGHGTVKRKLQRRRGKSETCRTSNTSQSQLRKPVQAVG
ncbi:unnamed protein product [Schistocephalus solidus]|uniref:MARVEL domain-containing protein n=1 Tax=Schistocephalus solidus TaxID=70667 RepID=A0A183TFL1_SCHSO|nr:unnamed protein product [Schistocephalus solidus]